MGGFSSSDDPGFLVGSFKQMFCDHLALVSSMCQQSNMAGSEQYIVAFQTVYFCSSLVMFCEVLGGISGYHDTECNKV